MVSSWWPCCCGGGGGTTPPDANGCCKCIEIEIAGVTNLNCDYAPYINGTYRLELDGTASTPGICGTGFGGSGCTYSATVQMLEVEDWEYTGGGTCNGCTDGATGSFPAYCRTMNVYLVHATGGSGPWQYYVQLEVPFRQVNVADPTQCEFDLVGFSSSSSNDCSQHTGSGTVLSYDSTAGCTTQDSTPCYSDATVADYSSATVTVRSPVDCFCDNCSETTQVDWTLTFDGATNDACTDCVDLAGTFVADSMVSNCRWIGKYPGTVTNCNGYTDVLAVVDVNATLVQMRLYYGKPADAICEDDWLTGSPSGVPTVAYNYLHTSGTGCTVSAAGVTPSLSDFDLAGCSNTAIAGSFDYECA